MHLSVPFFLGEFSQPSNQKTIGESNKGIFEIKFFFVVS
jgi:hypothetical protein